MATDEEFEEARRLARQMAEEVEEDEDYDDDEEEDDDERPRAEAFDVMTPTEFNAHRLEAWDMAYSALTKRSWGNDYDVDPSDVLILARFIEGDDLGD